MTRRVDCRILERKYHANTAGKGIAVEIRHLQYFIEIARYRNFSHAAEAIHVSQPTLSRTVRELEEELGTDLFRRTKREVELTSFGETFLPRAQAVVSAFSRLKVPETSPENMEGRVHIGIPPITAATSFGAVLGDFKKTHPRIQTVLIEQGPRPLARMLLSGLLDFGIFKPQDPQNFTGIQFEQDVHQILVPGRSPLGERDRLGYGDLVEEPVILYNGEYRLHDKILEGFQKRGIQPKILMETSQTDLMTMLVESGNGVAFLPKKLCARITRMNPKVRAVEFDDSTLTMTLSLVSRKGAPLSPAAAEFQKFFVDWMKRAEKQ